jgi:hypothetical protein
MSRPPLSPSLSLPLCALLASQLCVCAHEAPPQGPLRPSTPTAAPERSPPALSTAPRPLLSELRRLTPTSPLAHRCEVRIEAPVEVGVQVRFDPSVEGRQRRDTRGVMISMVGKGGRGLRGEGASLALTLPRALRAELRAVLRLSHTRCEDARGLPLTGGVSLSP